MFRALTWTTTRLPEPAGADEPGDELLGIGADASPEPLGAGADPVAAGPEADAEPLGAGGGVTDGAGAYVQPALAVAQPATTRDSRATDRKRAKRMVLGLSRVGRGGRKRRC